ncbi:MAG: hypothetical protein OEZ08_02260 [Betaproteobacteria bacterium]|nr:hypothetical protein [Betaproteobacteria bacterium]
MANPRLISPQVVLMPRAIGARLIEPARAEVAERHTGHRVSGASPFCTRYQLPIYVERSILDGSRIYLNGAAAASWLRWSRTQSRGASVACRPGQ